MSQGGIIQSRLIIFCHLRYSANGVQFYLVSLVSYLLLVYLLPDLPIQIYKNFSEIISTLNIFSLLFCVGLLIKGHIRPEVKKNEAKSCLSIFFRFLKALWTNLCRTSSMPVSSFILECLVILALKKHIDVNIKTQGWTSSNGPTAGWECSAGRFSRLTLQSSPIRSVSCEAKKWTEF